MPRRRHASRRGTPSLKRGGYEIVDKFAGKEIFISGSLAESFEPASTR